jgi:hypothetical protein
VNNIAAATPTNGQFSIGAIGPPCSEAASFYIHHREDGYHDSQRAGHFRMYDQHERQ